MAIDYQRASKSELKAEWRRISQASGGTTGYKQTDELAHLLLSLDQDERVVALSACKIGRKKYLLVVTSIRLLLLRIGFLTSIDQKDFYLKDIIGTEFQTKWLYANIFIRTSNGTLQIDELTKPTAHFIIQKIREIAIIPNPRISSDIVDHNSEAQIDARRSDNNSRPALKTAYVVAGALAVGLIWSWIFSNNQETVSSAQIGKKMDSTSETGTPDHTSFSVDSTLPPVIQTVHGPDIESTTDVVETVTIADQSIEQIEDSVAVSIVEYYVKPDVLNVRDAPNGNIVDKLLRNCRVFVFEIQGEWARMAPSSESSRWVSLAQLSRKIPEGECHSQAGQASSDVYSAASTGFLSEEELRDRMSTWVVIGQSAVKSKLRDPDSAEWGELWFSWGPKGVPAVCGRVNAKNALGGYVGMEEFITFSTPKLTFLRSDVADFSELWKLSCGTLNNGVAAEKWGPAAKIAPVQFR